MKLGRTDLVINQCQAVEEYAFFLIAAKTEVF